MRSEQKRGTLKKASAAVAATGILAVVFYMLIRLFAPSLLESGNFDLLLKVTAASAAIVGMSVEALTSSLRQKRLEEKTESAELALRAAPEKPQLAWDLARTTLEAYLSRNLAQAKSMFYLTTGVMLAGLAFVMYGLFQAFQDPTKLPVSIVAAASGVIISFIGGSFLLIHKSILSQSREYVTVLERINAVGMALQVIGNLPEAANDLKHNATADLAKQLLSMYSQASVPPPTTTR